MNLFIFKAIVGGGAFQPANMLYYKSLAFQWGIILDESFFNYNKDQPDQFWIDLFTV